MAYYPEVARLHPVPQDQRDQVYGDEVFWWGMATVEVLLDLT